MDNIDNLIKQAKKLQSILKSKEQGDKFDRQVKGTLEKVASELEELEYLEKEYKYSLMKEAKLSPDMAKVAFEEYDDEEEDDWDDDWDEQYGRTFASEGSALHAESPDNPRNRPCPTCGEKNVLTPLDVRSGYQCDACADRAERGEDRAVRDYDWEDEDEDEDDAPYV